MSPQYPLKALLISIGLLVTVNVSAAQTDLEPIEIASSAKLLNTGNQQRKTSQASREYHLKGAFLRYVAKYVNFPEDVFEGNTIKLCVLGQVPAFQGINSINGKVVDDRSIQVSKILNIDEAKSAHCQIVFVARTEEDNIDAIIQKLQNEPILGFGDMETYAINGGDMNFYIANNHLAIMTNMPAVERSKLSINPQMLKLVTFVPKTPDTTQPAS